MVLQVRVDINPGSEPETDVLPEAEVLQQLPMAFPGLDPDSRNRSDSKPRSKSTFDLILANFHEQT